MDYDLYLNTHIIYNILRTFYKIDAGSTFLLCSNWKMFLLLNLLIQKVH